MIPFEKECGLKIIKDLVKGDKTLSRIYGFILYTDKDPYVAKVLRDEDFWNALDSISGANWPIFAVRPLSKGQYSIPSSSSSDVISYMVPTWIEPRANMQVLRDFGLKDTENLPLFVAFMWDDTDELNQVAIPIVGKDIDMVYNSIAEIVKVIAKVEAEVLPQYKGTVNVFRNIVLELKALEFRHTVIKRGKIAFRLSEFLSIFV
jgi:hypothetical protein